MRAALPLLQLLTLPMDQISLLSKYLSTEEKTFLAGQLFLKDDDYAGPTPSNINPNKIARNVIPNIFELIPKQLIIKGYSEMISLTTEDAFRGREATFNVHRGFILKGVEILTRAKKFPDGSGRCADNKATAGYFS